MVVCLRGCPKMSSSVYLMIFNQMFDLIIPAAHRPAPRRHSLTIPIVKVKATVVHVRVTLGHLRVTIGHLRVTIGYFFLSANIRQTQLSFTPK